MTTLSCLLSNKTKRISFGGLVLQLHGIECRECGKKNQQLTRAYRNKRLLQLMNEARGRGRHNLVCYKTSLYYNFKNLKCIPVNLVHSKSNFRFWWITDRILYTASIILDPPSRSYADVDKIFKRISSKMFSLWSLNLFRKWLQYPFLVSYFRCIQSSIAFYVDIL